MGNAATTTGSAQALSRRSQAKLCQWIAIVCGLLLVGLGFVTANTLIEASSHTASAPASIVSENPHQHLLNPGKPNTVTYYLVTYSWQVDGTTYQATTDNQHQGEWADPAYVCYVPSSPKDGTLEGPGRVGCQLGWSQTQWILTIGAFPLLLVILAGALIQWLRLRRRIA